jgi:Peptidase family M28
MRRLTQICLAAVGICILVLLPREMTGSTGFSQENAYAILRTLTREIGPRPMGSPSEQQALEFGVRKFREYGCDESYLMPFTRADGTNTNSGNAIGIKRGRSGRIILIGGHIDTAGPEVPGANDNGSGAATVIELARIIGARQLQSTVLFCLWGGEERGLIGSKYFVDHFAGIDSVDLMLQIDMANGGRDLFPDPDADGEVSAPRWLVSSAYEIFYNDLHETGLRYPVRASTLSNSVGGVTGSDHIPFLQKGIPALCLDSDINDPIHTPQDNLSSFDPSGMQRSGNLVLNLVERFDSGIPVRSTEQYMLVQAGSVPIFVPLWFLWVFAAVTCVLGVWAAVRFRRTSNGGTTGDSADRRFSGVKIALGVAVVQLFVWNADDVVGLLRGYRFPWVNNVAGYVLLGILSGFIALWLTLRFIPRTGLGTRPGPYYLRSIIILLIFVIGGTLVDPRLAVFPALSLLCIALVAFVRSPGARILLVVLAAAVPVSLLFNEAFGFLLQGFARSPLRGVGRSTMITGITIAFFTLISLPFVYALVAVYRDSGRDLLWLRRFGSPASIGVISIFTVIVVGYLLMQPVYGGVWFRNVRANLEWWWGDSTGNLAITSPEFLRGVRCTLSDSVIMLQGWSTQWSSDGIAIASSPVFGVETDDSVDAAGSTHFRVLRLRLPRRPFHVEIIYRGDGPFGLASSWETEDGGDDGSGSYRQSISWYSYPDEDLTIPVVLTSERRQPIRESLRLTFDTLFTSATLSGEATNFQLRSVLRKDTTVVLSPRDMVKREE